MGSKDVVTEQSAKADGHTCMRRTRKVGKHRVWLALGHDKVPVVTAHVLLAKSRGGIERRGGAEGEARGPSILFGGLPPAFLVLQVYKPCCYLMEDINKDGTKENLC